MLDEYLIIAVAVRVADLAARGAVRVVFAAGPADAEAQAGPWALEELPPAFGWEGHTIRVELLGRLRPALAEEVGR
ncbi:MAG TPA: hypothetical protein PKD53_00500 [Chloroflexaceae bacterium]|nr:hypothetical protein [Chloroflexaceae bacterium]